MSQIHRCYLGLGSNIGKPQENLELVIQKISALSGVTLIKKARLYLTKAWGNTNQQDFINSAIAIDTLLDAQTLLHALQNIEKSMGRERKEKWGPRIIDIDILLYDDCVVKQPQLTIPHPYLTERDFVLAPLYELNKDLQIPNKGKITDFYNKNCESVNIKGVI